MNRHENSESDAPLVSVWTEDGSRSSSSTAGPLLVHNHHGVDAYLQDTLQALDPSFTLTVTESHCKSMVRALLGWTTKTELNAHLKRIGRTLQWTAADECLRRHYSASWVQRMPVAADATQFEPGLLDWFDYQQQQQQQQQVQQQQKQQIQQQAQQQAQVPKQAHPHEKFREQPPQKFFSFLARGRSYQGKFERLLQDVVRDDGDGAPSSEWLLAYENVVRERTVPELLAALAQEQMDNNNNNDNNTEKPLSDVIVQGLWRCAKDDWPADTTLSPADGGTRRGKQSEQNLRTFLEQGVLPELLSMAGNPSPTAERKRFRILSPVHIVVQQPRKGRNYNLNNNNNNNKCRYVIELPAHADWEGQTSELDALVVEIVDNNKGDNGDTTTLGDLETGTSGRVRICQVWEAKASLNPITIADALTKKFKAVQLLIQNEYLPDSSLIMEGQRFSIGVGAADDQVPEWNDTTTPPPPPLSFGLYGKALMKPGPASRRWQTAIAERLLSSDASVVLDQALATGQVSVDQEQVQRDMEPLLAVAQQLEPRMVVPAPLQPQPQPQQRSSVD